MKRRSLLQSALAVAALPLLSLALPAWAQGAWPSAKPVTIVVPFPAGGSTDMVARALALQLQTKLGGSFVVDNRPGATGTIGTGQVKRAPADGYTLLVSSLGAFVVTPHLLKGVPYDATKDFDYISVPVQAPNVLVANVARPERTVDEVLALLRKTPGKVSFASSGNGSSDHLSAELFWQQSKTEGVHVPYKGGAPAVNDLLGNQVDFRSRTSMPCCRTSAPASCAPSPSPATSARPCCPRCRRWPRPA